MKAQAKVNIHNRFDIFFNDKQVGYAENIVLDQMYTRLCGRSTYFVNIHFGTGTGTLSASRTSLFTHLGTKTAVNDAQSKALPTSWWRQKIVLNPEEYVGSALSEVGIAFGSTSTNLVTHALIRDMNGNVITLTKTALDVVTIYATVYVTFSTSNANLALTGMPDKNSLVNYLIGGSSFPTTYFTAGLCGDLSHEQGAYPGSIVVGASSALSWTADTANKKSCSNTYRFAIDAANGQLKEFLLAANTSGGPNVIYRLLLPATGIYAGLDIEGASVGTGDGLTTKFKLPSKNINADSVVVYVDGTPTSVTPEYIRSDVYAKPVLPDYAPSSATNYKSSAVLSRDGAVVAQINYAGNPKMSVWDKFGHAYVIRPSVSDIASLQDYSDTSPALSGNGLVLAKIDTTGVKIHVYDWDAGSRTWAKRTAPSAVDGTGNNDLYRLNYDGTVLIQKVSVSPYYRVWDWNAGTSTWTLRTAVSGLSSIADIDISQDGLTMAILGWSSPYLHVYDWSGSAWIKRADVPSNTVAGSTFYDVRFSADKKTIVCGFSSAPRFSVIDWDSDTSTWSRRADPTDAPVTYAISAAVSDDGAVVVLAHEDTSPRATIYDWINGAYVKRAGMPGGVTGSGYVFTGDVSTDGDTIVFGKGGSSGARVLQGEDTWIQAVFASAPATGAVITADYTVNGIHKTAQRVIDLYAEITFGEVT